MKVKQKDISRYDLLEISWALENLSKCFAARDIHEILNNVVLATRNLDQFVNKLSPIQWTEKEADISSSLHTYMRKYWDEPLASILYRMIDSGRGMKVWNQFIKILVKSKLTCNMQGFEYQDLKGENTDDVIMRNALACWAEDKESFKEATDWLKSLK